MTTEVSQLANGLRVATHAMAHVETASLGVWVGVGGRHEKPEEAGISHFLEHMAFKGTKRRSARAIAEEIESVGGELNAATSVETTAYYARVLKADAGMALELLADILQNSIFAEDEIEREREVITQEIAGIRDSPDDIAYDLLHDAAYPEQAVGRPIIGTAETVERIGAAELAGFLAARYRPSNMIVAAAGAIHHDSIVRHVEALFGGLTDGQNDSQSAARYLGGQRADDKAFEQSHLIVGFEGPSYRDPGFFPAQVLSGLLGGGMSSRLFQEVRERRGLCYSIYSSAWGLTDTGMLAIHAATGLEMMDELIETVASEVKRVVEDGPSAQEVARSKAQLKAGLLMGLESSSVRAEQMARHLLAHGRIIPSDELSARIDGVSVGDVRALAGTLIGRRPAIAVVGAGEQSMSFAEAVARSMHV